MNGICELRELAIVTMAERGMDGSTWARDGSVYASVEGLTYHVKLTRKGLVNFVPVRR